MFQDCPVCDRCQLSLSAQFTVVNISKNNLGALGHFTTTTREKLGSEREKRNEKEEKKRRKEERRKKETIEETKEDERTNKEREATPEGRHLGD